VRADLRIIATTTADLEKAIAEGRFSSELHEHLRTMTIEVPRLRDRVEDILPLAEFLMKSSTVAPVEIPVVTEELKQAMTAYDWPENVRELKTFTRRFLRLADADAAARELRPLQNRRSAGMHNSN
jgi:DNA-binding NtrC family response regulator